MKKELTLIFLLALLIRFPFFEVNAQTDNDFTPYGKPLVLIYTNVNSSFTKSGNSKAFELTRAYLGFEYFFSKKISSRVNIDIGDPGIGKLQMTAFVKNAFLLYKYNGFSARFGMIGVDQFNVQEKQWGYRYIYKSFQDAYNFGPSADLGAAIEYSPAEFITLDFSVLNGEGYKKLQSDSTLKTTFGLTIRLFKGFVLRGYYDMMNHNYNQTSVALYAGYSNKDFKAGTEYNIQKNNGMVDSHDFSGISVYTSLLVAEKFSVFTRYDNLWSATLTGETNPWNNKDGQLFIVGFDYSPTHGVKIAPTYFGWSPNDKLKSFTSIIALNVEIKF
ncbi:MAG: hypothetical protein ABII90_09580 [Bacteroidota bacterium]